MIKFAKISKANISEKEIQKVFVENLNDVEDGLEYIGSFVPIGTGIIDVLAIDRMDNAVIIEFKRMGDFDEDALIQLMNYYSWFEMDENHFLYLKEVIQKKNPEFSTINDIRLMAVVSHVSDRVKNACWAVHPYVKLVTYSLFQDSNNETHVTHDEIIDTSKGGEKFVNPPKTEEEHFKKCPKMKPLYNLLKEKIQKIDDKIEFNVAPQSYIGVIRNRIFLTLFFYPDSIWMDMRMKPKDVEHNKRVEDNSNSNTKCHTEIYSENDIDDELMHLIRVCYEKN